MLSAAAMPFWTWDCTVVRRFSGGMRGNHGGENGGKGTGRNVLQHRRAGCDHHQQHQGQAGGQLHQRRD